MNIVFIVLITLKYIIKRYQVTFWSRINTLILDGQTGSGRMPVHESDNITEFRRMTDEICLLR